MHAPQRKATDPSDARAPGRPAASATSASGPAEAGPDGAPRPFVCHTTPADDDAVSRDVWGFADTRFALNPDGCVVLTGARYALSGQKLPNLLPWVEATMGIEVPRTPALINQYPAPMPEAKTHPAFCDALHKALGEDIVDVTDACRLRHGHGHTQEEMYAIKYGRLRRVPDMVAFPRDEEQVLKLVRLAAQFDVCLIPYGGGTNVTEALRCPEDEVRPILSVDMRRMDRILWIDEVNRMACIEAGAVGRHLTRALAERGLTMGHEPDSIEFSTLGGWIATNASGMKKNKYGNIEDLVLDMNVVTPQGVLTRTQVAPRESTGTDPRQVMFGSEGNLGIVTSAVVKLFPVAEACRYGSIIFPSFEDGVQFLYALRRAELAPASVRLVDNTQFQLSMALKPAKEGLAALKSRAEKFFVTRVKGFDPDKMAACTLVFEGTEAQVRRQEEGVYKLAREHRGMRGGSENGERGYQLTYGIAYIRDFVMQHLILAESFETSLPWSQVLELCERVKARVRREHAARKLPGRPLITCRVTQLYDTGVAVYFYLATSFAGVSEPTHVYGELEHAAREEILAAGGSLSHHHGIGKLRRHFLPQVASQATLALHKQIKQAIDPANIFGARNAHGA